MSDSTTVLLTVLTTQADVAKQLFTFDASERHLDGEQTEFSFWDINYGELPFLDKLCEAGIAYDSTWCKGSEYSAGTASIRFTTEGTVEAREVYDNGLNPDLYYLLALIDKPVELRQFILDHKASVADRSWDNQEEYGKVYMAKQLINPK